MKNVKKMYVPVACGGDAVRGSSDRMRFRS